MRALGGWEGRRWVLAVNPTLERAADLRGGAPLAFGMQSKVGYRMAERWLLGVESYDALGSLERLAPPDRKSHMLYATIDGQWRRLDVNFGVGKGLTRASDGWAVKAVVGVALGAP